MEQELKNADYLVKTQLTLSTLKTFKEIIYSLLQKKRKTWIKKFVTKTIAYTLDCIPTINLFKEKMKKLICMLFYDPGTVV